MDQKSKSLIYRISKFVILSFIIIYFFYFKMNMPVSLVLIFELLLLIKLLPISKFIEKKLIKIYPKYSKFNIWVKRLILLVCFIIVYLILKLIIINLILEGIFNIPVEEQINDFINKSLEE